MFLRIILLAISFIGLLILVSQIIIPIFSDREFFWFFKKKKVKENDTDDVSEQQDPISVLANQAKEIANNRKNAKKRAQNYGSKIKDINKTLNN